MAEKSETVPGYSGSPHEGQGPSKPPTNVKVSEDAAISPAGASEPPLIFKGDGVTPADAETPPPANAEPKEGEEIPEGAVVSPAGITAPTLVFKGDGVTPEGGESPPEEETEEKPQDYEQQTVPELKDQAESRGIDVKYDWTKGDIIKALKKADKAEGK